MRSRKRKRPFKIDKQKGLKKTKEECEPRSASEKKINNAPQEDQPKLSVSGNIMVSEKMLQAGIFNSAVCIQCKERGLVVRLAESEGWASKIEISCFRCGNETSFWSSPSLPTGKGRSGKAINRALNIGMRAIGKSHSAAVTLSGFLDMPPPVSSGPWANHTSAVLDKVMDITEQARFEAARRLKRRLIKCNLVPSTVPSDELKSDSYIDSLVVDIAVSFDGSWKNRGNQSHHCTTTAISMDTGEILDTEYLCNSCRSKDTGLRYTTFIGDGDSKSFRTIERMKPYGEGVIITKEECLGHIRKRMGTNLRKSLDKNGGNKLSDGRTLGGAGRLTKARIDSFQYFYGQALLSNKGNAQAARDEILASLQHYSTEPDHSKCPDRWCKRKRDTTLPPVKNPLAPAIVELIKPIFEKLADLKLLEHCSMCVTQNANESFHSLLWSLAPKEVFNSPREIMLALEMARMYFNQGRLSANMILIPSVGLTPSVRAHLCFLKIDLRRVQKSVRKEDEEVKHRRLVLKASKRHIGFKADTSYQSGSYHSGSQALVQVPIARKDYTCRTCGKPMKGHKRDQCAKNTLPLEVAEQ